MGTDELKKDRMMAHLLSTLDSGHSIGHYGRLVFAIVARHFLEPDKMLGYLRKDPECDEGQARSLMDQVESRGYNPPKRERILEWMQKQDFPVCPDTSDPGQCNVYRSLDFPKEVYERIEQFHQELAGAQPAVE
ncbi:MAG: hypothetical protein U0Q18_35940 [Bryobacteraceae bacterium]